MKSMLIGSLFVLASMQARAEGDAAALAEQPKSVKVTLAQALKAGAAKGKPISAKFELEYGRFQLSVYTVSGAIFSEMIVDHATGEITRTETIISDDDLSAAKAQSEAMVGAKISLQNAVVSAQKANKGYRAVSITPSKRNGRASAEVTLLKGSESKTVVEQLD